MAVFEKLVNSGVHQEVFDAKTWKRRTMSAETLPLTKWMLAAEAERCSSNEALAKADQCLGFGSDGCCVIG